MSYSERKGSRMNTQFDEELNRFINVLEKQITSVEIEYDNLLIDIGKETMSVLSEDGVTPILSLYQGAYRKKKLLDMMINEINTLNTARELLVGIDKVRNH